MSKKTKSILINIPIVTVLSILALIMLVPVI